MWHSIPTTGSNCVACENPCVNKRVTLADKARTPSTEGQRLAAQPHTSADIQCVCLCCRAVHHAHPTCGDWRWRADCCAATAVAQQRSPAASLPWLLCAWLPVDLLPRTAAWQPRCSLAHAPCPTCVPTIPSRAGNARGRVGRPQRRRISTMRQAAPYDDVVPCHARCCADGRAVRVTRRVRSETGALALGP